jgi:hypothetical protein
MAGFSIVGSKTTAYKYRRHSESQTSKLTKSSTRFVEQISFLKEVNKRALSMKWSKCSNRSERMIAVRAHLLIQTLIYVFEKDFHLAKWAIKTVFSGKNRFAQS